MSNVISALLSDVGPVRTNNEDRTYAAPELLDEAMLQARGRLFIVADGMGGYAAGEVAAQIAVDVISEHFYGGNPSDNIEALDVAEGLREAIAAAQEAITQEQARDAEKAQMGSALVAAVVRGDQLTIANVGDCRAYGLLAGKWQQLSVDHSWVAEQVAAGVITPEQGVHHPMRSALTRALGQASVSSEPVISMHPWHAGDRVLMCSDGLWDSLTEEQLRRLALKPPAQAVNELIQQAIQMRAQDNVTACVLTSEETREEKTAVPGMVAGAAASAAAQVNAAPPSAAARRSSTLLVLAAVLAVVLGVALLGVVGWGALNASRVLPGASGTAVLNATQPAAASGAVERTVTAFPTGAPPTALPTVVLPSVTAPPPTLPPTAVVLRATDTPGPSTPSPTPAPSATALAKVEPTTTEVAAIANATAPTLSPAITPSTTATTTARAQPAGEVWLCNRKDFEGAGCASDVRASLDPLSTTIYASWSPALATGKDFQVFWRRFEKTLPVLVWSYKCSWVAANNAHSCVTVPASARNALPAAMNDFATGSYSIFSNGDKTGDGKSPGWGGIIGFLGGRYRFELLVTGATALKADFEVTR